MNTLSTVRHLLCGVFVLLAALAPAQASLIAEARAALASGESDRALVLSQEILRQHPRDAGALNFRAVAIASHAQALANQGQWDVARDLVDEGLTLGVGTDALLRNRYFIALAAAVSLAEGSSPEAALPWLAELPPDLPAPYAERRRLAEGQVHVLIAEHHRRMGEGLAEREHLETAARWIPENVDVRVALIQRLYSLREFEEAQRHCREALELDPTRTDLRQLSLKMSRDARAMAQHRTMSTEHFIIHFPPGQEEYSLTCARMLERAYLELCDGFGISPIGMIDTIIYREDDFRDVMIAPDWAQAGFDGRLRFFIVDISHREARYRLENSLTHELTHAFIHAMTRDRCPIWLNEGLASNLEANRHFSHDDILEMRRIMDRRDSIAITDLPHDFGVVHGLVEAQDTYHISHCFVHWLIMTRGLDQIGATLTALGDGVASPEAIATHLGAPLDQLDQSWREGL